MKIISFQSPIKFLNAFSEISHFAILFILVLSFQVLVYGQDIQMAGSIAESKADGVNIFSGELEQSIPLLSIKGRGEVGHNLLLPIRNIKWNVVLAFTDNVSYPDRYIEKYYAGLDGASTPPYYRPAYPSMFSRGGYGLAGKIQSQTVRLGVYAFDPTVNTTVTFTSNDGSIIEFRDAATDGQPLDATARGCYSYLAYPPPIPAACSRGRVFNSTKGENATFVADTDIYDYLNYDFLGNQLPSGSSPSGTLFLGNGTRMIFSTGFETRTTDRNGNSITFEYDANYMVSKITDSLNRDITINYGDWSQPSYFDEIVYKGFGGTERRIRINYKEASQALVPGQQQQTSEQLFPEVLSRCYFYNGSSCGTSPAAGNPLPASPKVVSSIVLPDQRQFQLQYNSFYELSRIIYPTGADLLP